MTVRNKYVGDTEDNTLKITTFDGKNFVCISINGEEFYFDEENVFALQDILRHIEGVTEANDGIK